MELGFAEKNQVWLVQVEEIFQVVDIANEPFDVPSEDAKLVN